MKHIFTGLSLLLLAVMLLMTRKAGISCDEVLHYRQSVSVYNYFATGGSDLSALNTPQSHLKYYGQSFDNIATFISEWFGIEDVYTLRHLMSAIAGWLTALITALFAVWLSGYRSGIIVIILFALSPTFLGHSQNNLKDVPFALACVSSLFFMTRFFFREGRIWKMDIILLIISIAMAISIRSGGLLMIFYLFLFFFALLVKEKITGISLGFSENITILALIILASFTAFFLGILLWPYALQSPFRNVLESYRIMAHFPSTFRQLFEGRMIWSDLLPWYFLPKSMILTIPLIISAGFLSFLLYPVPVIKARKTLIYGLLLFTVLFPPVFAIAGNSNIYSSWRQFLFIYPVILLLAATGLSQLFDILRAKVLRVIFIIVILIAAIHPVKFMINNVPYSYLYYNEFAGGLKGAYGNYESDYYYLSQTEASHWLIDYLNENGVDTATILATYPVDWHFRHMGGINTGVLRYEERSQHNWDFAIVSSRYIAPEKLRDKSWLPENAIHIIYADNIPLCAVLKRNNKDDFSGYAALTDGRNDDALRLLKKAIEANDDDEMIFYNFARALYNNGQENEADSVLKVGLNINPSSETILMYLGNIASHNGYSDIALEYYEKVIEVNRKYFDAWVGAARVVSVNDLQKARKLLKECLKINPKCKPALVLLADTYKESDPELAEKYYRIAETLK